MQHIC